jgi:hypothetical protein
MKKKNGRDWTKNDDELMESLFDIENGRDM